MDKKQSLKLLVVLPPELHQWIVETAKESDRPRSAQIRHLIRMAYNRSKADG